MEYKKIAKQQAQRAQKLEKRNRIMVVVIIAVTIAASIAFGMKSHRASELEYELRIYQEISKQQSLEVDRASETMKRLSDSLTSVSYERDEYKARYESAYAQLARNDEMIEDQKNTIYGLKVALKEEKRNVDAVAKRYTKELFELRNKVTNLESRPKLLREKENHAAKVAAVRDAFEKMRVSKYGSYIKIESAPANARVLLSIYPVGTDRVTPFDKRVTMNKMGIVAIDLEKMGVAPPFVMEIQDGNRVLYHKSITASTADGHLPTFDPGTKDYTPIRQTGTRGTEEGKG